MIADLPVEELQYGLDVTGIDPASLGDAVKAVVADVMSDPLRMTTWMSKLAVSEQTIGLNMLLRLAGEKVDAAAQPSPADKRFTDDGWRDNPMLAGMVEAYLARTRAAIDLVELSRVPAATKRKARFAIGLFLDTLAPSNVPWINPAVVKEAISTGGSSLVRGMENFLEDVRSNQGRPRQVDASKFTIGGNLACTPGRIVMRNELIELIAYEPQTATVFAQPILFSPPWINKYYIMDLAPGRSFAEWAVKHGFTVFCISYRNPDASMGSFTFDDYFRLGLQAAIAKVRELTGSEIVNVAALCLGGTMATAALGYFAATGQQSGIGWTTLTNTLVDFSEPGDLGVFTDESTISRLEERMRERGYLESTEMSGTFDWLRGNDLVWSYVVTNWYMGRTPPAFDILAWNGDGTRMPATMHSQYLRTCYLDNRLVTPKEFSLLGAPIDLSKVTTPLYVLGAENDHIAPWHASFRTTQLVGGRARYVLTSSGHVAGIVNPPGNPKSSYRTGAEVRKGMRADEWLASSTRHAGSWWEDWLAWASQCSGKHVAPPKLPKGEAAPGGYVVGKVGPPFGEANAPRRPKASAGSGRPSSRSRSIDDRPMRRAKLGEKRKKR